MTDRSEFEREAENVGYNVRKAGAGLYFYDDTEMAWELWQAACDRGVTAPLKPIAKKKLGQLGGDVCGVLVRKDGRLAAVDEHGRVQWLRDEIGQGAEPVGPLKSCACQFNAKGELLKECLFHQTRYKPQPPKSKED